LEGPDLPVVTDGYEMWGDSPENQLNRVTGVSVVRAYPELGHGGTESRLLPHESSLQVSWTKPPIKVVRVA
jgi:hypothetical protein